MIIEITDERVAAAIERMAEGAHVSVQEAIGRAVLATSIGSTPPTRPTPESMELAIREFQDWYAGYANPMDLRTAEEIIGYDDFGLPS